MIKDTNQIHNEQYSNVIPMWRFALLCIVTFGFYELYWFYKNWKFFKEKENLNISPFWRATFFAIFFIYGLFKRIFILANKEGYTKRNSPGLLTFFWIVISIIAFIPQSYSLLAVFSFITIIPAVKSMNYYWAKKNPNLPTKSFSWWQIILIILGIIWVIFALIGMFVPA
jgi:hypothetical protein